MPPPPLPPSTMMPLVRLCCLVLFLAFAGQASAQRVLVPLYDFKDIPVGAPATAARVKAALVRGALNQSWEVVQEADGSLLASALKSDKHYIKVRITYDATKYSLVYLDSRELKVVTAAGFDPKGMQEKRLAYAEKENLENYRYEPSTPFAVKSDFYIHPYYEGYVRELLASLRRHLMAPEV